MDAIKIGIGLVVLGALAGAVAYHWTRVAGLEKMVEEKDQAINKLATRQAELVGDNTLLRTSNDQFKKLVGEQKEELKAIQRERAMRDAAYQVLRQSAERSTAAHQRNVEAIMAQQAGKDWCDTWAKLLNDYVHTRRSPP